MASRLPTPAMDFCGLDTSCYTYFFFNWQALIGGMTALLAAYIAGRYVKAQIRAGGEQVRTQVEAAAIHVRDQITANEEQVRKQIEASDKQVRDQIEANERQVRAQIEAAETQDRNRRLRRETAVRSVFPLTLTQFNDYAEACAAVLTTAQGPVMTAVDVRARPLNYPQLLPQAVGDLERMIEAAESQIAIELMAKLAGHTQVLHSVMWDFVADINVRGTDRARVDPNLPSFEIRTARVYATASQLYQWARGEVAEPNDVTWDNIESALQLMNIGNEQTAAMIQRARDRGRHPLDW